MQKQIDESSRHRGRRYRRHYRRSERDWLAAARRFGRAGMQVVLFDLPGAALDPASSELAADGIAMTMLPTDVTDRVQITATKTQVARLQSPC
jgi:hypothetical protein